MPMSVSAAPRETVVRLEQPANVKPPPLPIVVTLGRLTQVRAVQP
jgi:hypothetical protein